MAITGVYENYRTTDHYEYVDYIKDGILYKDVPVRKVMVTSDSQLSDYADYPPGSIAYNVNNDVTWTMGADGEWSTGPVMIMMEATDDGEGNITLTEVSE